MIRRNTDFESESVGYLLIADTSNTSYLVHRSGSITRRGDRCTNQWTLNDGFHSHLVRQVLWSIRWSFNNRTVSLARAFVALSSEISFRRGSRKKEHGKSNYFARTRFDRRTRMVHGKHRGRSVERFLAEKSDDTVKRKLSSKRANKKSHRQQKFGMRGNSARFNHDGISFRSYIHRMF